MSNHHERLGHNKAAIALVEALAWRIHCEAVGIPHYSGQFDDVPEFMKNYRIQQAIMESGLT